MTICIFNISCLLIKKIMWRNNISFKLWISLLSRTFQCIFFVVEQTYIYLGCMADPMRIPVSNGP